MSFPVLFSTVPLGFPSFAANFHHSLPSVLSEAFHFEIPLDLQILSGAFLSVLSVGDQAIS
jgi:hypothetical protein